MTLSPDRLGRFTASNIWKLVRGPKGGSATRDTYIFEVAQEAILGHKKEFFSKHTEHGHLNEYEAIESFRVVSGLEVDHMNQQFFIINDNFGATPDFAVKDFSGKILASGDAKCPTSKFFEQKMNLIKESKPQYQNVTKEYFYQAQAQMLALGVDEHYLVWYLTSMNVDFDGNKVEYNLPIETRLFYKVIKADRSVQDMLLKEVEHAAKERDLLIEIMKKPII